jgi:hypothetical protein
VELNTVLLIFRFVMVEGVPVSVGSGVVVKFSFAAADVVLPGAAMLLAPAGDVLMMLLAEEKLGLNGVGPGGVGLGGVGPGGVGPGGVGPGGVGPGGVGPSGVGGEVP